MAAVGHVKHLGGVPLEHLHCMPSEYEYHALHPQSQLSLSTSELYTTINPSSDDTPEIPNVLPYPLAPLRM